MNEPKPVLPGLCVCLFGALAASSAFGAFDYRKVQDDAIYMALARLPREVEGGS